MDKYVNTYNIKVVSDKATFENVGEYKAEIIEGNGTRTMKLTIVMNEVETENSQLVYDSETFLPIESFINMKLGETDIRIESHYKKGSIELTAITPNGTYKKKLKNKGIIYDNLQVYDLISKLDFTKEKKYIINILNIQTSVIEEYEVSYCCLEDVKIHGNVYSCSRLSLSKVIDCTEKQFLLYSNCSDRKLIKAINKGQVLEYTGN